MCPTEEVLVIISIPAIVICPTSKENAYFVAFLFDLFGELRPMAAVRSVQAAVVHAAYLHPGEALALGLSSQYRILCSTLLWHGWRAQGIDTRLLFRLTVRSRPSRLVIIQRVLTSWRMDAQLVRGVRRTAGNSRLIGMELTDVIFWEPETKRVYSCRAAGWLASSSPE